MSATIRHHLSDALLTRYAAGHLPEAFALVAAVHVSLCDDCRARLAALEALGGALVEEAGEMALAPGALDRALARLGPAEARDDRRRAPCILTEPLRGYVGGDERAVRWRNVVGGVRQAILPTAGPARARLVLIPPGQAVPDHGHRGTELTLVLQGAYSDSVDRFGPGDLEISGAELEHRPRAEEGPPCICLTASDAPLRFTGFLPRLFQPIFRI